jgi:hypothetical protein
MEVAANRSQELNQNVLELQTTIRHDNLKPQIKVFVVLTALFALYIGALTTFYILGGNES